MASPTDDPSTPDPAGATGRRDFMRRAAVVGTGAFVVPRIVTVDPADAQALTSPPPEPPGRPDPPPVQEAGPPGHRVSARTRHPADPAAGRRETARTELPRTGANLDRLVAAGLAATAGGAALVLWNAEAKAGAKSAEERPKA
jgi:hypothetical protein